MNTSRIQNCLPQIILIVCLSLTLASCGSLRFLSTPTPIPPTVTPTPTDIPTPTPTVTPTPSGELITPIGSGIAGSYKSVNDKAFNVLLGDTQGYRAILELTGDLRWDNDGTIIEPSTIAAKRIQTLALPDQWIAIADTQIIDGLLVITTEDGIFPYFTEGYTATPIESVTASAEVIEDGIWVFPVWKGPARLIITGFSFNFSALVFLDSRNFSVIR